MWRNVSAAALRRHHWAVRIKSHHTHTQHTRADRNHYTPTYISLPHCLITSHLQCRWRRYPAPLRLLSTRPCSDIHAKIFFQMIGTHEKIEFLYQVSKMCRWILISNTFIPCLKGKLKPEVIIFFGGEESQIENILITNCGEKLTTYYVFTEFSEFIRHVKWESIS